MVVSVRKRPPVMAAQTTTIPAECAPTLLSEIKVTIDDVHLGIIGNKGGVLFQLESESQSHVGHASKRPEPEELAHG